MLGTLPRRLATASAAPSARPYARACPLVRRGGHDSGLFGESDLLLALVAVGAPVGWLAAAGPTFLDAGVFGVVPFFVACLGVVLGAALVVMAASDWRTAVEVTGPILRLRTFGNDDKSRCYVAVDDGASESIRAWRVSWARYEGLEQGDVITARLTRNLCCVRWIVQAEDAAAAG